MKLKNIIIAFTCMVLFIFLLLLYISRLQNELSVYKNEITINDCYFCGEEVRIKTVCDSYFIECDNCKIKTTYFKSKYELIKFWNMEE